MDCDRLQNFIRETALPSLRSHYHRTGSTDTVELMDKLEEVAGELDAALWEWDDCATLQRELEAHLAKLEGGTR